MVDVFNREKRSEVMSRVRSKDTGIEVVLRKLLYARGIRGYRVNYKKIPGSPDIAFTKFKLAVFVDGCFWHGCPLCYSRPSTNSEFWARKLEENRNRDILVDERLQKMGWQVLRLWEHEVEKNIEDCVSRITGLLKRKNGLIDIKSGG